MKKSVFLTVLLSVCIASMSLCACSVSVNKAGSGEGAETAVTVESDVTINVASLKGPTSIGLVHMMEDGREGNTKNNYNFLMRTGADEILPMIVSKEVDIALIPANVAGVLYNKTKGGIEVIDINTLGVLSAVSGNEEISDITSLSGKTVYLTGKGTTPDYVLNYLLTRNEVTDAVLEYKSEPAEVAAILKEDPQTIGILPEPFVTATLKKNPDVNIVFSFNDEWDKLGEESSLVTGVTVVRKDFLEKHPEAVENFLSDHRESVEKANEDIYATAKLMVDEGIMDNEELAASAVPNCNVVCIDSQELKKKLSGYLKVLFEADETSVGGTLPGDDFYYEP